MKKDNSIILNDNDISKVEVIYKDIKEKVINDFIL